MTATTETLFTRVIPVTTFKFTTGTWTTATSGGILSASKSATDETTTVSIPICLDRRDGEIGVKLTSIEVPLRITTADLDAVIAGTLSRVNLKAVTTAGTNIDATAITITETGTGVTANAADRLYTATISSPAYDFTTQDECYYQLDLSINAAATTVVKVYSATAKFARPD